MSFEPSNENFRFVPPPGYVMISDKKSFVKVWQNEDGHQIVETKNSIAVLVYISDKDQFLFVNQCRDSQNSRIYDGETIELVAGRLDKKKDDGTPYTPLEIAIEELEEEAGIKADPSEIHFLRRGKPMPVSPGANTEKVFGAWIIISSDRLPADTTKKFGNSHENEHIKLVFVDRKALEDFPELIDSAVSNAVVDNFMLRCQSEMRMARFDANLLNALRESPSMRKLQELRDQLEEITKDSAETADTEGETE